MLKAIAVFQGKLKGYVHFKQLSNCVRVTGEVKGLKKLAHHGIHIHEYGDLREGCKSACKHFNPFNTTHGGRNDTKSNRHIGDLGNISTSAYGVARFEFKDSLISLRPGKTCIVGRSVVIHKEKDDLGKGGDKESLKTGNAGARLDCAVIGFCK